MRRLSLSAKLFVAALPLIVAIGALLAVSIRDSFGDVADARRGARLGAMWDPLIGVIQAMESEQDVSRTGDPAQLAEARRATNEAMVVMNNAIADLGDGEPLTLQLGQALAALGLAREAVDTPALAEARDETAATSFDEAENDLIALGRLLPAEAGDRLLGRELTAVAALAEVEQAGSGLIEAVEENLTGSPTDVDFDRAELLGSTLLESVSLFQAVAPEEWLTRFREEGFPRAINEGRRNLEALFSFDPSSGDEMEALDIESLATPVAGVAQFRDTLAGEIVTRADATADDLQARTLMRAGITLLVVAFAGLVAWIITRSITRRVRAVSNKANEVSDTQLPALVEALRDPKGRKLPEVVPLDDRGSDELGELAYAFNSVQRTLVEVASEQVEVLRRGVSDIFVTMARRNRSLVDRQLALLDELEAEVDDPEVLANYYHLDHLATRMRRNSESLLVLASAEPKRRRTKATEIDDVVRAAIGEVEDYRRIDVADLENLQVRGNVVADISHLLAELLDNATSFSPPESRVRVSGRFAGDHYMITISDEGVGIGRERIQQLNELLAEPPVVGLSVEPTLGMSVVSLLAKKHGIRVELSTASPGLTVEVLLPSAVYGPIDTAMPLSEPPTITLIPPDDALVEWTEVPTTPAGVPDLPPADRPAPPAVEPLRVAMPAPNRAPGVNGTRFHPTDADHHGHAANGHTANRHAEPPFDAEVADAAGAAVDADGEEHGLDLAGLQLEPEWTRPTETAEPLRADPELAAEAPSGAEPAAAPPADEPELAAPVAGPDVDVAPPPPSLPPSTPLPPPAVASVTAGEFDRPPAPPSVASSPAAGPFADPAARPLPGRRPADAPPPPGYTGSGLPVRARGTGPEGGPDRLGESPMTQAGPPASLQAALSAFDAGRKGQPPELPTRQPGTTAQHDQVAASSSPSRLDPDAIRQRLRAFQNEHRNGRTADDTDEGGR